MQGLLVKDCYLMFQRNRTYMFLLICAVFMAFSTDTAFVVGYITTFSSILPLSTLSYDEYDNGYAFLMTLPITRKTYIQEKYLFSLACDVLGWIVSMIVVFVVGLLRHDDIGLDILSLALIILPIVVVLFSVQFPVHLKYGAEKARIVLFIFAAAAFAGMYIIKNVIPGSFVPPEISYLPLLVLAILISLLILYVSYRISLSIFNNREF